MVAAVYKHYVSNLQWDGTFSGCKDVRLTESSAYGKCPGPLLGMCKKKTGFCQGALKKAIRMRVPVREL